MSTQCFEKGVQGSGDNMIIRVFDSDRQNNKILYILLIIKIKL